MTEVLELPMGGAAADDEAASTPQLSERAFVARLRRRDPVAFETLVRTHQHRVYDFCLRMVVDREEAFDVTQDVFVAVHAHLDSFRADAKLSTWLFRIAKNHCLNRLKYLKRRGRGRSDEFTEANELHITESMGGTLGADEALRARDEQALVHAAIAQLDEDHRLVVLLRDVEGLSYDEIADIADVAEGTVKSRLHRAREKLADILVALEAKAPHRGHS